MSFSWRWCGKNPLKSVAFLSLSLTVFRSGHVQTFIDLCPSQKTVGCILCRSWLSSLKRPTWEWQTRLQLNPGSVGAFGAWPYLLSLFVKDSRLFYSALLTRAFTACGKVRKGTAAHSFSEGGGKEHPSSFANCQYKRKRRKRRRRGGQQLGVPGLWLMR